MAYELFENKATRFSSPQLSIRSGRIAFNADAGDIWNKSGSDFAHLLWDAEQCKLAIRPVKKQDQNSFRVSTPKGKRAKLISAASFLNHIQWSTTKHVVLDANWNVKEGMFEVALPKEHIAGGIPPKTGHTQESGTQRRASK